MMLHGAGTGLIAIILQEEVDTITTRTFGGHADMAIGIVLPIAANPVGVGRSLMSLAGMTEESAGLVSRLAPAGNVPSAVQHGGVQTPTAGFGERWRLWWEHRHLLRQLRQSDVLDAVEVGTSREAVFRLMGELTSASGGEIALLRTALGRVLRLGVAGQVKADGALRVIAHTHTNGRIGLSPDDYLTIFLNPKSNPGASIHDYHRPIRSLAAIYIRVKNPWRQLLMLDLPATNFPAFLKEEFDRMTIPGDVQGFAISRNVNDKKKGVACGLIGNSAILIRYTGEYYAVSHRTTVSLETFEELCREMPSEMKESRFLFEEDTLDGETYLVKWIRHGESSRCLVANPRHFKAEGFRQLGNRLDRLMEKCRASPQK